MADNLFSKNKQTKKNLFFTGEFGIFKNLINLKNALFKYMYVCVCASGGQKRTRDLLELEAWAVNELGDLVLRTGLQSSRKSNTLNY